VANLGDREDKVDGEVTSLPSSVPEGSLLPKPNHASVEPILGVLKS
jgi:hypothetical protein